MNQYRDYEIKNHHVFGPLGILRFGKSSRELFHSILYDAPVSIESDWTSLSFSVFAIQLF